MDDFCWLTIGSESYNLFDPKNFTIGPLLHFIWIKTFQSYFCLRFVLCYDDSYLWWKLLAKIVCHVMLSPTHQKMWNYAKELANFFWGIWNGLERICFRYSFWLLELNMKNSLELSRLLIRVLEGPVYSLVSTTLCRRNLFYSNCHLFWVDVLVYVQLSAILDYFTD